MTTVLTEITTQKLDRDHVARRVEDWVGRINGLYDQIEAWLPLGWTADRAGKTSMHEPLMEKFNIPPRELPVLRLSYLGKPSAHIEPEALWIVPINGQLDLYRGSEQYLITDRAENFEPPQWYIAPVSDRRDRRRLNRETLISVL